MIVNVQVCDKPCYTKSSFWPVLYNENCSLFVVIIISDDHQKAYPYAFSFFLSGCRNIFVTLPVICLDHPNSGPSWTVERSHTSIDVVWVDTRFPSTQANISMPIALTRLSKFSLIQDSPILAAVQFSAKSSNLYSLSREVTKSKCVYQNLVDFCIHALKTSNENQIYFPQQKEIILLYEKE